MLPIRAVPFSIACCPAAGRHLACAVALALFCGAATADSFLPDNVKLSGFGTLGMVHANTDTADFSSSVLKASGAGASGRWSGDVDSRLAIQADVALIPQWSAVLQVVSEQQYNNSYRPHVEWANVKYQVTPDIALRVGRVSLPVFMAAEHRKVGYVYSAVRQPIEVSGGLPITSSDGADVSWRWRTGEWRQTTRVQFGRTDMALAEGTRLRASAITGLSHTVDVGSLTARASFITGDVTVNLADQLFGALKQFGPAGIALADRFSVDHKRFSLAALGMEYDPGDWFVNIEGGRQRSQSLLGTNVALAVGAGYRWRNVTPYIGYSTVHAQSETTTAGLPLAGLPPQLAGIGAALNGGLNQLLVTMPEQSTICVGTRWDAVDNIALKFQFERVTPHGISRGTLINPRPDFVSRRAVSVTSVALDFVF
jgi:hypothetical protein